MNSETKTPLTDEELDKVAGGISPLSDSIYITALDKFIPSSPPAIEDLLRFTDASRDVNLFPPSSE